MTEPPDGKYTSAFIDFIPNMRALPDGREQIAAVLRRRLEARIDASVDRYARLPPIAVSLGPHAALLAEARELYVNGYLYSCVAQCGITAERTLKDLLARSLQAVKGGVLQPLPEASLEHLDHFEQARLARFLAACELITTDVRKAALDLATLRNSYAHGSGKDAEADAFKALGWLHVIIEGTVSLLSQLHAHPSEPT